MLGCCRGYTRCQSDCSDQHDHRTKLSLSRSIELAFLRKI